MELAELVETSYVVSLSRLNQTIAPELKAKLASLHTQLAGPNPSPALELATAAAVHAWLDHWTVEMIAAHDPGKINLTLERRRTCRRPVICDRWLPSNVCANSRSLAFPGCRPDCERSTAGYRAREPDP